MTDESFHLTPLDVRRFEFASALRGYDKSKVDQFRDQVADELERVTRANQELDAKAKGLTDQLKQFKDRDKALNDALVSAQQLRAEIREQADREAQLILREARAEGDRQLEQARAEIRKLTAEIDNLERVRRTYLLSLKTMVEKQITEVEALTQSAPPGAGSVTRVADSGSANGATDTPADRKSGSWLDSMVRE